MAKVKIRNQREVKTIKKRKTINETITIYNNNIYVYRNSL